MSIKPFRFLIAAALLVLFLQTSEAAGDRNSLSSSTQLIVVTTSSWDAVDGQLQRYQRSSASGPWRAVGNSTPVVVGKNGMGWGAGIVPVEELRFPGVTEPAKKEGDGKAPAGIFRLGTSFGYAGDKKPEWKMPYITLTMTVDCVDDSQSRYYNRIVDREKISQDWTSSEHMLRDDELYRWGVVVDHNANPPKAGEGSCIFLHIWRGPGQGTVGCTAMPQDQVESILGWLDPKQTPVLVQLPIAQYQRLRNKFGLPVVGSFSGRPKPQKP